MPTLTIWNEADLVFRFAHHLTSAGRVPIERIRIELGMQMLKGYESDAESHRRVDIAIGPVRAAHEGEAEEHYFGTWTADLFVEVKSVPGPRDLLKVGADASKLYHDVWVKNRARDGLLLVVEQRTELPFPELRQQYQRLCERHSQLGALVYFRHSRRHWEHLPNLGSRTWGVSHGC